MSRLLQMSLLAWSMLWLAPLPRATAEEARVAFGGRTVLVMVDSRSCVYCRRWEKEVQSAYVNSSEGRAAPLVKRERGHADLAGISGIAYTPTFILFEHGREVGRIVGYGGEFSFWSQIEGLWQRANFKPGPTSNRAEATIPALPSALGSP